MTRRISPLDDDVVWIILSYLNTRDLMAFSRACKRFREPAIKRALTSEDGVCLDTCVRIFAFSACILSDAPRRGRLVKSLAFEISSDSNGPFARLSISSLAVALKHCSNLTKLTIGSNLDQFTSHCPELYTTLTSLQSIEELHIIDIYGYVGTISEFLCDMQSQLRVLSLEQYPCDGPCDFPLSHPANVLSTARVEKLKLTSVNFPPKSTVPWTSVREFEAHDGVVRIAAASTLLPNLRICTVLQGAQGHLVSPLAWNSLDVLRVNVIDMTHVGPVPARVVEVYTEGRRPSDPELSHDILRFLEGRDPLVLSVGVIDAPASLDFWDGLRNLAPRLRCLDVGIRPTGVHNWPALLVSKSIHSWNVVCNTQRGHDVVTTDLHPFVLEGSSTCLPQYPF